MRLNLGCADRYADGWVNVDWAGSPHWRDQTVDLTDFTTPLPWGVGTVDRVYLGHVLEHLALDDCTLLLDRLRHCMAPGGVVLVVGPDVELAQGMVDAGTFDPTYHSLESLREGANRWPGDEHYWWCTTSIVMRLLRDSHWQDVRDVGIGDVGDDWPVADRNQLWQCAVTAVAR